MQAGNDIPYFIDITTGFDISTSGSTDPKCITQLWWGRLEVKTFGTNGDVVMTIETSFDLINWTPWNECSKLKLTESLTHIRMYELDGLWYRIVIDATNPLNTNTAGTMDAKLFIKALK